MLLGDGAFNAEADIPEKCKWKRAQRMDLHKSQIISSHPSNIHNSYCASEPLLDRSSFSTSSRPPNQVPPNKPGFSQNRNPPNCQISWLALHTKNALEKINQNCLSQNKPKTKTHPSNTQTIVTKNVNKHTRASKGENNGWAWCLWCADNFVGDEDENLLEQGVDRR